MSVIKIGITGGIGSGKSFFSSRLKEYGIPVFDSDSEAKKLMLVSPFIVSSLKSLLGDNVYIDGKLNKSLIADYIFSSPTNAHKINSIVHPCVKKEFLSWVNEHFNSGNRIVAIESAILLESGFDDIVDKVVTVHAPLELRISRVMKRDHTSREKVLERINSQMSDDERNQRADFVIENDGLTPLDEQIERLFSIL